ncbi:MAG TPA: IS110 family transposase [Gemmataceae bacterium]|jgi:transposase|nr:IS110 family transposase [Gemmataceae bacterium]
MTTTPNAAPALYVALELGWEKWLIACATQAAEKPRFRTLPARDLAKLRDEIARAKARFGLAPDAPVFTCFEAGRDGFWLHRALTSLGIVNVVVDSSAIEVNRRRKQVKSDPVDAGKLLNLLCRYHGGERKVWSVVNVPGVADEDRRQLHRGLKDLQRQQTECSNRIKGLLASQGLSAAVDANFRTTLAELRDWSGQAVPAGLRQRIVQEFAVWEVLHRQVRDAANEQERQLREGTEPHLDQVRRLMGLKAVGVRSAWILVAELFSWREIRNGKQLGSLVGLTPTPYDSGQRERDQGISKAGNKHVRSLIVELAWLWLRWQPGSVLSQWYERRFGSGNKRARKVGIVALARKLLIALWRYVEHGELPAGAEEKDWRLLVDSTARRHAKQAAVVA